jgi:hypothetical protein
MGLSSVNSAERRESDGAAPEIAFQLFAEPT